MQLEMRTAGDAVAAARVAEQELWRFYGLTVRESRIEAGTPSIRVRVLECGNTSGVPLVFVQGGLGEAWGWASLMAKLTDFRCITLDRPGGGFSGGIDFLTIDLRRLAVDVLQRVLDATGIQQAAFVANSMGGWWTFQLAMRAPERVSRMVMAGCPAVLLGTSAPLPMRMTSTPLLGRALVRLMVPSSSVQTRDLPVILGHPREVGQRWSEYEAEVPYRFGNLPDFQRSWRTLLRLFLRPWGPNPRMRITADQLRNILQPTLFIWGKDDPFGSVDAGRRAAALMPDARLEVVGIGHLPWWDDADACARLVREFVRTSAAASVAAG
jgi:pimeloyl-ACP methyl ester carboxylesterase